MRIYEFVDYRKFLFNRQKNLPSKGRGELTRMAQALGIHTTMISHIMKGTTDFSLEQALKLADYLSLNSLETDYLVALVQLGRAGDRRTKEYCQARVNELRKQALDLQTRLKAKNEMSEVDRAYYYSSPIYAYVRLLSAIERFQTPEAILEEVQISPKRLKAVLDFLISRNLCEEKTHRVVYGQIPTYIEASSPIVTRHHMNWRQKAQEKFDNLRAEDLVFTFPTTMSEEDFEVLREKLVQFIEEFKSLAAPSPADHLYCLNVDWLKISRK
jgi:uncharacterized protein (TIGR02147 family)